MTNTPRQRYGLGSFIKKITKPIKKIAKSKLGKAAILGGGLWGLGKMGGIGSSGIGKNWWSKGLGLGKNLLMGKSTQLGPQAGRTGGLWNWMKANPGKAGMIGLGTAGVLAPFLAKDEDEGEEIQDWTMPSAAISGLWDRTKDYYKNPGNIASSNLAFMPKKEFVDPLMYAAQGGIAQLANGGNPAEAQAEQMLKMEYQKYRNQGGTMSYQQFKMAVLQQAQGQGPMAQGQPQRASYQGGELVEDASMMAAGPGGMMEENVEEVQGEPTREQLEALAMEIFQLRLEELDEEQLMVVYQAAMEQQPREEEVQEEIAFNPQMGAPQMAAYGGRIRRAEGGIMDLGGMEKDYRAEGGFVPLGGEERADDVPARLSKNEFVFTADAVRNAGGGDIDQGAEVMQNMMENLEAGGQISEESQGGGGEEMISEEELIEAPNGAQEMYNQQAMLESRME